MSELYEVVKGWLDYAGVFEKIGLDLYGNDISSGLSMYLKYIDKAMKIIIDKVTGQKTNYTNYGVTTTPMRTYKTAKRWCLNVSVGGTMTVS